MAKNTQEAEVIVTMNGQAAKKAVAELAQEYEKLQKEALEAYKAGNDALGKKLDAQAQKLMKDIEITRRETKKFADVMKNINGASLKELRSAAKQLQSEINKLAPGTQAFIEKSKQLQQVNTRIRQLTNEFKGLVVEEKQATFSLKGLADGFNKYFGMVTAGIAAITGVSMALKKCAQDAAAMDDAYATVMKTTSLTHEEVEQLNDSFKRMDTRTAREDLNKMAYEAGKLGFTGVENIRQFVEAADIINVALGDVLGEGATLEIAKLAQVFAQSTAALENLDLKGRMLAVGSAINQLGKESTASESYMVDFLGRLGGVATQAGISADQILGYASALDQMKQKVEMSATAFQKLIQQMIKKPEEFVEAAKMPLEEFTKLMETDMNGAIKRVLEGFNEMGGFTQLVPVFKDMGLDGARAASVIAALAANLDKVSAAQETANEHIRLGTSMTREYTIMNTSMQAKLEKARKEFKDICIELGQRLNPVMLKSTKGVTYLIKALATYGKEMGAAAIAIAAVTLAIKRQAVAQTGLNVVQKVGNTLRATGNTILWAARTAFFRLIGATEAATIAQQQLNAVMSASVFGVIALAVAGLTAAITHWVKKSREANEVNEKMLEIERQADVEYTEQAARVRALTAIVENNNIALGQRKKALEDLKKIVPGYHGDLTEEGKLINSNKTAIDEYCKSLREQLRLKAREEQLMEIERQIADLETKKAEADEKAQKALEAAGGDNTRARQGFWGWKKTDYGEAMDESESMQRQIDALDKQAEKLGGRIAEESKKIEETSRTVLEEEGEKTNAILTQAQFDYLQERYDNLTKKEKAMVDKGYASLSEEESKALKAKYVKLTKVVANEENKRYQEELKALEAGQRSEENALKQSLLNQEISQAEFNAKMNLLTMKYLQKRIETAKKYGQDETKYVSQLLDEELKLIGDGMEEMSETMSYMPTTPKSGEIVDPQANEEFWKKIYEKRDDIVASIQKKSLKTEFDTEMMWIEKLHQKKLLSEKEFEKAKLQTKLKYAQQYAEQANSIANQVSNFVTALKDAESAQMEAEYQKQLTAAGDNAERREQIEAEYEQKQLDLKKKYADTEMAINIAKTIASGAVAAIKAYAEGGPYLGIALAALIAATTAAEVATIVAQRNAIKNTSVGGGGSSSVPKTGERKMTGYAEGGYTEDHTTLTTVGEKGREWVGPAWMVRKNPVMFANLERYRLAGSHGRSGSMSRGFADGGFTPGNGGGTTASMPAQIDIEAAVEAAIRRVMEDGAIRAYVVYKDIEELNALIQKFKKLGSR